LVNPEANPFRPVFDFGFDWVADVAAFEKG
jgi:hypothetical protein